MYFSLSDKQSLEHDYLIYDSTVQKLCKQTSCLFHPNERNFVDKKFAYQKMRKNLFDWKRAWHLIGWRKVCLRKSERKNLFFFFSWLKACERLDYYSHQSLTKRVLNKSQTKWKKKHSSPLPLPRPAVLSCTKYKETVQKTGKGSSYQKNPDKTRSAQFILLFSF